LLKLAPVSPTYYVNIANEGFIANKAKQNVKYTVILTGVLRCNYSSGLISVSSASHSVEQYTGVRNGLRTIRSAAQWSLCCGLTAAWSHCARGSRGFECIRLLVEETRSSRGIGETWYSQWWFDWAKP